jgi:beta-galactosidase
MSRRILRSLAPLGLLVLVTLSAAFPAASAQDAARFFPTGDLMRIGVYYYPEHWPREQWDRDFANMEKLGLEFVHMGEFAWAFMEPEDGRFEFEWLDHALELAARHNLRVILCTPTPCPPAWLAEAHPEIFLVQADGRRREHGSRANNALADPTYLRYCDRITAELSRRYGRHPAVWGWQLDNEPSAQPDYSPSAQGAFRDWVRARYGTVETLNREWGTAFWSVRYNTFDQVRIPDVSLLYGPSPHAVLDFKRFTADQTARFLNRQAGVLRRHTAAGQWITTNYISNIGSADPRRSTELDFAAYTIYLVRGEQNLGDDGFRLGWQPGIAFTGPFYKGIKGATGVMELQPGQVNWATTNPQPMPGVVRMWLWHAFATGASFASPYRYRQPLYGSELYHYGIVNTDGVSPTPGGKEYSRVAGEMRTLRAKFDPESRPPAALAARRTGILWSHENLWDLEHQRQTPLWDTWGHLFRYVQTSAALGAPIEFLSETDDFSKYPFLVAPAYQLLDEGLAAKWKSYAERGGHLVLTCRTGQKKKNGQLREARWAEPILDLIGADIPFFDLMLENGRGKVRMGTVVHEWNAWADVLRPHEGTLALARYDNQFYAGQAAATYRRVGKGSVTYIGVHTRDGRLERALMKDVFTRAGVATADYPEGVYVGWRDGFWVGVNYSSRPVTLPVPPGREILFGTPLVKPADVVVWR